MEWQLMVILQLGVLILVLAGVFTVRNFQLARANRGFGEAMTAAEAAIAAERERAEGTEAAKSALETEIKSLQEQLVESETAAQQAREAGASAMALAEEFGADSPEAMRDLLRKFTQESRDLLSRVHELERENRSLRGAAGLPERETAAAVETEVGTADAAALERSESLASTPSAAEPAADTTDADQAEDATAPVAGT